MVVSVFVVMIMAVMVAVVMLMSVCVSFIECQFHLDYGVVGYVDGAAGLVIPSIIVVIIVIFWYYFVRVASDCHVGECDLSSAVGLFCDSV